MSDLIDVESPQPLNSQKDIKEPSKKPKKIIKKKKVLVDESIQGTNDSSIVSKRSVERLYWKKTSDLNRPVEFFRHFVPKPQRRSPIINRGYWTRMEAMKSIITKVLKENQASEAKGKVIVVNLGCGFDPYPFQYLAESGELCEDVAFLDVDYTDLILKKASTVSRTKELSDIIGPAVVLPDSKSNESTNGKIYLQTEKYVALGCDLRELAAFESALRKLFDLENSVVLFTAEVSLTYMIQETADALIKWASSLPRAEFALLEQIMPGGEEHPFAKTMLKHFNSLKTPLHSISAYPNVEKQRDRFLSRGWKSVKVQDLFNFWRKEIPESEKHFVETVEDFDEWEEFILFGQHYFILHASGGSKLSTTSSFTNSEIIPDPSVSYGPEISISRSSLPKTRRRFSAGCSFDGGSSIFMHGGLTTTRETSSLIITSKDPSILDNYSDCPIPGRMCHTASGLPSGDILLVGGRLNPSKPLKDCWLLVKSTGKWSKMDDLPSPRYRHSAVCIRDKVLVFGGSVEKEPSPFIIWSAESGWKYIEVQHSSIPNLFSSSLSWNSASQKGAIVGGMDSKNIIHSDAFIISYNNGIINAEQLQVNDKNLLARYGSNSTFLNDSTILISGGVSPHKLLDRTDIFISLDLNSREILRCPISQSEENLPMLIGSSLQTVVSDQGNYIVSYGGGCICFSFGSIWDDIYTIGVGKLLETPTLSIVKSSPKEEPVKDSSYGSSNVVPIKSIPIIDIASTSITEKEFNSVLQSRTPTLFRNNNLGSCLENWKSPNYLVEKVGANTKVVAHVTTSSALNFQSKNFEYKSLDFQDFISQMFSSENKVYLRSLSTENPKTKPALFKSDFPSLSRDFKLPPYLDHIQNHHFSSPFRLSSSNTSMWLHYDVTANVLCQVVGEKRVRLYPPEDVIHLSFPAGSSSSTIENIFDHPPSTHNRTHPIEIIMKPGDIIFIPSLWLHATQPLQSSISLNFFWKDLDPSLYAAGKDIYGNRDIAAYEDGRKAIAKLVDNFKTLPEEIRKFYLLRLSEEIRKNVN